MAACGVAAVAAETAGGAVVEVVVVERDRGRSRRAAPCPCPWPLSLEGTVVELCTVVVVAVEDDPCLGGLVSECSPVTISTMISTVTTPTAASGAASRRGRWSMECIALSPSPRMNDELGTSGGPSPCP